MQLPNSLIVSSTRPHKIENATKLETIILQVNSFYFSLSFHFFLFPYVHGYGYHISLYNSRHTSLQEFSFKKYGSFPFELIHLIP